MAEGYTECKCVCRVLRAQGYTMRPATSEKWLPMTEVDGRYGTTDETSVA